MPKTETEELHERLEKVKKAPSNAKQHIHLKENTDSVNESEKTRTSHIVSFQKGRSLRFLNSIAGNNSFIIKTLKSTTIGLAVGLALSLLFPPLGIAILAISAMASIAAIGAKIAYTYAKTKGENNDNKDKEEIKQQDKKNSIANESKQNIEALKNIETKNSHEVRKSAINANEFDLKVFTKPLNSSNPNIKREATASKPKAQQETQSRTTGSLIIQK